MLCPMNLLVPGFLSHTLFVRDTPNMMGSHQAADCLSAPWESHPRPFFVDRPRITEVSLSPVLSSPTRKQSGLFRISFIARPFGVMAHLRYGLTFRSYRIMCLMNGYSIFNFCERIFMSPHYSDKKGSKCKVFRKSFFKYFFEIFFCSFNLLCNCRS